MQVAKLSFETTNYVTDIAHVKFKKHYKSKFTMEQRLKADEARLVFAQKEDQASGKQRPAQNRARVKHEHIEISGEDVAEALFDCAKLRHAAEEKEKEEWEEGKRGRRNAKRRRSSVGGTR